MMEMGRGEHVFLLFTLGGTWMGSIHISRTNHFVYPSGFGLPKSLCIPNSLQSYA